MLTGQTAIRIASAIVVLAVASTAFRVITAPERMAKRRAADAQACTASGGTITKVGNDERCLKPPVKP